MTRSDETDLSRRTFVRHAGIMAGGMVVGATAAARAQPAADPSSTAVDIPRRVLGKTGESTAVLSLGTGTVGLSPAVSSREISDMVNVALDLGINFIDTARVYNNAEEGIGKGLGRRRKETFLATKVGAETVEEARASFETSLRLLRTDHVDLVYFHSVGDRDGQKALGAEGVFTWLLKQKKAGTARFVGISGHNRPARFLDYIETGEVDVALLAMNLADRYTYGFENRVLPAARKHRVGVLAMKVFGGKFGGFANYGKPNLPPMMDTRHLELGLRYALQLPGVCAVNIGPHDVAQLRENVRWAKRLRPLTPDDTAQAADVGKQLASQWGEHFGPAVEEDTF